MFSTIRRNKTAPTADVNINAQIQFESRIMDARILKLTCWQANIYLNDYIPINEVFVIRFIYGLDYVLSAKILEKVNKNEFKIEFIFTDWRQRETLRRDIK